MKKIYLIIIIGLSIPLVLFGLFVMVIAINVVESNENSDKWMIELEPHLNVSENSLYYQINNEDIGNLQVHKVRYLDEFVENLPSDIHGQLEDVDRLDNRYVLYIDKKSGHSEDEIRKILTDVEGIKNAEMVFPWIVGKR
jgi:hypothetical protein